MVTRPRLCYPYASAAFVPVACPLLANLSFLGFLCYTRYHFVAIHIDSKVLLLDGIERWILLWLRPNNHALLPG